ncbi:MAG TPA: hypothetical protein PKK55_01820 [Methanofastidiosum sp.]|nr:hypothetical protein [Methanofastidiosum sp.]HOG74098.1 hypothetical protein [Methanofastidiosum sp.]HRZ19843.1 hypothetical protein [Methanofastidiosum sp.]
MLKKDLVIPTASPDEIYSQLENQCHDIARLIDSIGNSLFVIDILAETHIKDRKTLEKILTQVDSISTTVEDIENKWGTSKVFKDKMLEYLRESESKI